MIENSIPDRKSRRYFLKSGSLLSGLALLTPTTNVFSKSKNSIELSDDAGELRFVHTSGLNGQLGPTLKGQFGGLNAIAESLTELGFQGLKIDAGDFLDPEKSLTENLDFIHGLKNYGLHLAGLGRNELALSESQLLELTESASFSLVNTNYRFKNPELDQAINKHLIVNFGKYKMGVIAVTDGFGPISKKVNNPIKSAIRESELLKYFYSCDMVVCLTNFESKADSKNSQMNQLARNAEHIDFILDVTTRGVRPGLHLIKDQSGDDVLISNVLDCGKFLGDFSVSFTPKYSKCMVSNNSRIPGLKNPSLTASIIHELSNQHV